MNRGHPSRSEHRSVVALGLLGGLLLAGPCLGAEPQEGQSLSSGSAEATKGAPEKQSPGLGLTLLNGPAESARREALFAPNSRTPSPVTSVPSPTAIAGPEAGTCSICLEGNAAVSWSGTSGSFTVDQVTNHQSAATISGTLRLQMKLTSTPPAFGATILSYDLSDYYQLGTLQGNHYFSSVASGAKTFYTNIPNGIYYLLMSLDEFQGGSTWAYDDFVLFPRTVSCSGGACSANSPACIQDSVTLCLLNNRFQVRAEYMDYGYNRGVGGAVPLTGDSGYFYFFGQSNVELVIKAVSFCNGGSSVGIYASGLTDVQVLFKVLDVKAGIYAEYPNALRHKFTTISDGRFPCGY